MTEVRGQRSDDRGQMTEVRRQKTDGQSLPQGWGALGRIILPQNEPENEIYLEIS